MQKLLRAGIVDIDPKKNARPSVTDVMVIDGPACVRPILNLSDAVRCIGV